jgi:hypothetical protein
MFAWPGWLRLECVAVDGDVEKVVGGSALSGRTLGGGSLVRDISARAFYTKTFLKIYSDS